MLASFDALHAERVALGLDPLLAGAQLDERVGVLGYLAQHGVRAPQAVGQRLVRVRAAAFGQLDQRGRRLEALAVALGQLTRTGHEPRRTALRSR